jgi:hypothetical protein
MSTEDAAQTIWKRKVAGTARFVPSTSISRMIPLRDGTMLLTGQDNRPASRVYIFDPKKKKATSRRLPLKNANAAIPIPGGRLVLFRFSDSPTSNTTQFMLWDPAAKETQSFTGEMPAQASVCAAMVGDTLSIIASSSVDGSSGGFDWKSDTAWAGSLNLSKLCVETPFHKIEDIDASAMAMLTPETCFLFAHGRTRSYCHLRDTRVLGKQKGIHLPNSKVEPDLSTPFFNLSWAGQDSEGGLLFAAQVYSQTDHGDTQTALFRWTLDTPSFEMVGSWSDGNCYFSEAVHLKDGSTLLFFSERQTANILIRRYIPGEHAKSAGQLTDTFYVSGIGEATDGTLYMYGCKPALKDGKWLIAGPWDLYVISPS